jgi:hypothetical protein
MPLKMIDGVLTLILTTEDALAISRLPPIETRVRPELLKIIRDTEKAEKRSKKDAE